MLCSKMTKQELVNHPSARSLVIRALLLFHSKTLRMNWKTAIYTQLTTKCEADVKPQRGKMHSTPLFCNKQRVYSNKFSLSGRDFVRSRTHVHRAVHAVAQSRDVVVKDYGRRSETPDLPKTVQRKNPEVRRIQPFDLRKTCTRQGHWGFAEWDAFLQ